MQALFHLQQLVLFIFQHLGDGDAGPLVDHLGDVVDIHNLVQLVVLFPAVTVMIELIFNAQTFRFHPGSAFIIPLDTRMLFFF